MSKWDDIERLREPFYKKYTGKFYLTLLRQIQPVLAMPLTDINLFIDNIPFLLDPKPVKKLMQDLYVDMALKFRRNFEVTLKQQSFEEDLFIENLLNQIDTEIAEKVTQMNGHSADMLKRITKRAYRHGVEEGLSVGDLERAIKKEMRAVYGNFSKSRARTIAHTEIMTSANESAFLTAKETGLVMRKIWIPAPIGVARVKERHALLSDLPEQRPLLNEPFIVDGVQMMKPGDPAGGAENVINCNCAIAFEVV